MIEGLSASKFRATTVGTIVLAMLFVAACGESPASPQASAAAGGPSQAVASAPLTASPAPPSPSPVDPSPSPVGSPGELALAVLADPLAALHADLVGTLDRATTTGTYDQAGRDFHTVLTTTLEGVSFTVEQVIADEQSFILSPGHPWLHDPVVSGAERAPTLSEALGSVALTHVGSAEIEGVNTEQYELTGPAFADLTASMGLSDPGATLTNTSGYLFASSDGQPVALTLKFATPSADGVHASDYAFAFGPSSTPVSIDAPADPWIRKADGHGYRMWYPEGWTANLVGEGADGFTEDFSGPDARARVFCNTKAKLKLKEWAADGRAFYTKEFGGKPDAIGEETVGGLPARWTRWDEASVEGNPSFVVNIALVKGPVGCDIQWFRAPGPTGPQDDEFTNMWGTFALD